MAKNKKSYLEHELLPDPNIARIENMARKAGYRSISDLSKAVIAGGSRDLLGRALSRERNLKLSEAVTMAAELNVPFRELLDAFGYDLGPVQVPIAGTVRPNGQVQFYSKPRGTADGPDESNPSWRCVIMHSAGQPYDGYQFFYDDVEPFEPAYNSLAVVKFKDDTKPMLATIVRALGSHATLLPFAAAEQVDVRNVETALPVVWIGCVNRKIPGT